MMAFGLGCINWVLAIVGIAVMVTGPNREALRGYGIVAILAALIHLMLLSVLLIRFQLAIILVPTQYGALVSYLPYLFYADRLGGSATQMFAVITGTSEAIQLLFEMLTLMALARAAGDSELGYQCNRAGAVVLIIIGLCMIGVMSFIIASIETGFYITSFGKYGLLVAESVTRLCFAGMMLLPSRRALDVAELCDAPNPEDRRR
jgi:hypothetical protein